MEDEVYYGIIEEREEIQSGIYILYPSSVIKGKIVYFNDKDEEISYEEAKKIEHPSRGFMDDFNNVYSLLMDSANLSGKEKVVSVFYNESDILDKAEDVNPFEYLNVVFNKLTEKLRIAIYVSEIGQMLTLNLNIIGLQDYFNKLNVGNESAPLVPDVETIFNILFSIESDNKTNEQSNIPKEISFPTNEYLKLLEVKDYDSLHAILESIYNSYLTIVKNPDVSEVNDSINIDQHKSEVFELINNSIATIKECNDIEKIREIVKALENMTIKESLDLDKNIDKEPYIEHVQEKLYSNADKYREILDENDLNLLKEKLINVLEEKKNNIVNKKEITPVVKDDHEAKQKEYEEIFSNQSNSQETNINIKEMKNYFDERIIGQEQAKRDVILALKKNKIEEDSQNKSSCLLIGPTGSGKTLIAETVGKYLDIPVQVIDTTQLTVPGYVGANIEDFLVDLLDKTNGDLERAEHGVIVLDELDKKGTDKNSDVSGKGVLNTLLPFIQGTTYNLTFHKRQVEFHTNNLTIFGTGAFTNVVDAMNKNGKGKNYSNSSIGFNSSMKVDAKKQDITYPKITGEELVKYGNIPAELVGRFTTITQLEGHTKESLKKILTTSLLSPLLSLCHKLDKMGVNLEYTEDYLDEVAEYALSKGSGARSLNKVIEESTNPSVWAALYGDVYYRIILKKETIKDPLNADLVGIDDKIYTTRDVLNGINSEEESSRKRVIK